MPEKPKWSRKSLKKTLALMEANEAEKARRLARYDEAVRLLRECGLYTDNSDFDNKVIAFLAAEPKEGT